MSETEHVAAETQQTFTCPHCHKSIFVKIGHAIKEVGIVALETAIEVALPTNFGGSGE